MERNITIQKESNACKLTTKGGYCPKPLELVSAYLSKKWTISIITTIGNFKNLRFNDLMSRLEGITPKTLTERLRELEKENIIQRKSYHEIPPRVEYKLTKKGVKLRKSLVPLIKWAERR